jgi:hypothetical protein
MDTLPIGGVESERGQHLAFYFSVVPTVNLNPIRVEWEEPLRAPSVSAMDNAPTRSIWR